MYTNIVNTRMGIFFFLSSNSIPVATYGRRRVFKRPRHHEGWKSYRAYNLSWDICPRFRRSILPASLDRSACLQIDFKGRWFLPQIGSAVDSRHTVNRGSDLPKAKDFIMVVMIISNLFPGACFRRIILFEKTSVTSCLINDFFFIKTKGLMHHEIKRKCTALFVITLNIYTKT